MSRGCVRACVSVSTCVRVSSVLFSNVCACHLFDAQSSVIGWNKCSLFFIAFFVLFPLFDRSFVPFFSSYLQNVLPRYVLSDNYYGWIFFNVLFFLSSLNLFLPIKINASRWTWRITNDYHPFIPFEDLMLLYFRRIVVCRGGCGVEGVDCGVGWKIKDISFFNFHWGFS